MPDWRCLVVGQRRDGLKNSWYIQTGHLQCLQIVEFSHKSVTVVVDTKTVRCTGARKKGMSPSSEDVVRSVLGFANENGLIVTKTLNSHVGNVMQMAEEGSCMKYEVAGAKRDLEDRVVVFPAHKFFEPGQNRKLVPAAGWM